MAAATRMAVATTAAVLLLASCTSSEERDPATSPAETFAEGPGVDVGEVATDVRTVPQPLPGEGPGDVVALAPRSGPDVPAGARAWDVLYRSVGLDGEPVAVSGVVYAPGGPSPAAGRPVLSWAHGTVGIADSCAPSRTGVAVPGIDGLLEQGFVVAATDYEGLGTPGPHPYLVGRSEGRSVLDAARAAARIEGTGADERVVAFGHSQGGHAVLFAGQLAPEYAPELDLLGVVASAPAAELSTLLRSAVPISLAFGLVSSAVYAYSEAYDELAIEELLTPAALERIGVVEERCVDEIADAFIDGPPSAWLTANPLDLPAWAARVEENEPGSASVAAPVLLVQGSTDFIVLASSTDTAVSRLCQGGNTLDYRRYPGADHGEVLTAAGPEILSWLELVASGGDVVSTCGG